MTDQSGRPDPEEPVRGPGSGIQVPDSAIERHLREAAEHVKPAEDAPKTPKPPEE